MRDAELDALPKPRTPSSDNLPKPRTSSPHSRFSRVNRQHLTLVTAVICAFTVGYFSCSFSAVSHSTREFSQNSETRNGPSKQPDPSAVALEQPADESPDDPQPQPSAPTEESPGAAARDDRAMIPRFLPLAANGCPVDAAEAGALLQRGKLLGPLQWKCLPADVQARFTLDGRVRLTNWFINGDHDKGQERRTWTGEEVAKYRELAREGRDLAPGYCGASKYFLRAFDQFPVTGQAALVIGSIKPWVESLLLMAGAGTPITTIDFNPPISQVPELAIGNSSLLQSGGGGEGSFDAIISYSSLEHDGLGRYGDPIRPDGDIQALGRIRELLRPGGRLFLGVPVGRDLLAFNAHRVYGPVRLARLLDGWRLEGFVGDAAALEDLWNLNPGGGDRGDCGPPGTRNWEQPVLVLSPDDGEGVSPCCRRRLPCHFCFE
uniref:Uncharacterized protein n=1 Tax=Cryptomonas curvata TaxID=233186 RepID=A0A7S0MCR1_9CRYP|mmetsp:Transcript_35190/g.73695  ORF Transcript_35190/g.73695 Transcript_35190/m.73695 type:complete len:434 (+) Transcript_35190:141-1442(+)